MGRDRGRSKPEPIRLSVSYERLNAFFAEYEKNIRRGSTFIATERPLPVGTDFTFELTVPKLGEPLVLRGRVQWVVRAEESGEGRPAGMGIGFVYEREQDRAKVAALVEKLMVESLGRRLYEKVVLERSV